MPSKARFFLCFTVEKIFFFCVNSNILKCERTTTRQSYPNYYQFIVLKYICVVLFLAYYKSLNKLLANYFMYYNIKSLRYGACPWDIIRITFSYTSLNYFLNLMLKKVIDFVITSVFIINMTEMSQENNVSNLQ